ncbi:MAG: radical SAM protein [Candidatus Bathyarchaeota archaeon]|nr:radical SAM protein [Candidatus Bathyarchaeota archaeon]
MTTALSSLVDLKHRFRTSRARIHKILKRKPLWACQPGVLQIDTTNRRCPLNCVFCNPQHNFIDSSGDLPLSTIEHVASELKRNGIFINYARPWMNTDPTVENRLPEICAILKKHLGCRIDLFTNGVLFKKRHMLVDENVDDIRFTISAANADLYNEVHGRPLFSEAVKTINWVKNNKLRHHRMWVNFILFEKNAHDLHNWQEMFADFKQDIRVLHYGEDRLTSSNVAQGSEDLLSTYRKGLINKLIAQERPCTCFENMAISYNGKFMQCCDISYEHNWGHVEEIDIQEAINKRLDVGLNHEGCKGCVQKNPHWKELFEEHVWS